VPTVDNLKSILVKQKEVLSSLETEIINIENSDLLTENESLKTELVKYQASLEKEKSDNLKILEENKNLRNALYEQFYNEKIQILNAVNSKMDVYYKSNIQGEVNRLTSLETSVKKQIDEMVGVLKANRVGIENEIYKELYKELEELRNLLNIKITLAREELARQTGAFSENTAEELAKLKQEKVTEEEIKARVKQNNIESFIGLNIINKLGVLLLVIGVIAASQFTYTKLPDILKGIFAFTFGVVLLIAGELLNRKKPNVFSLGITSGGIAVLYVALALSFFKFEILDIYPALGLCVLITAAAFVLSQRYNSQTISTFAMIGGYLPLFSIAGNKTIVYGAMVYFVILNMLALIISVNRKWTATAYIGFVLNVIGSLYITSIMFLGRFSNATFSIDDFITILYIIFVFIIYTLIPVMGSFRKKLSFKNRDIVLMTLNTVISTLLLYSVFYILKLSDFKGLLAIVFAIVYLALGRFVEKFMTKEQKARALFYITGLTFIVLIIPFQFGKVWLSLGWLVEGITLLSYGIYKELKDFKKAGGIISFLCFAAFILLDISNFENSLFVYKYLAITSGSIIVLRSLMYKKNLAGKQILLFKYATAINLWIFLLYITGDKLSAYLSRLLPNSSLNLSYLTIAAIILVSFLTAYIIPRIRILCDNVMKAISIIIYVIALIALFFLNFSSPVRGLLHEMTGTVSIIGTVELAVITILAILALRDLILCFIMEGKLGIEWYPLIISFYFVVVLTQNLIIQYGLGFNNAVISIIYLITALVWITFGFIKRYAFIRRFGLGLSMLSVAKLFIIDLSFLSQGYRIASYFIFGVTLIVISFVYQYFSKRIDSIGEVMSDVEKTDN
jgi:Predicted membrane protein